jgi:signal transduction histidine kinase
MAATVAHEINNPLAAALNAIYIARTSWELHEPARSVLVMAEQELVRASHITRQTLGFYRESTEPKPLDLAEVLNQLLGLYHHKVRNKSIRIKCRFKEEVTAFAVEGEIRQVFSNLIANAIDAVPAGGTIWLRLSETTSADTTMSRITIADNGPGIAPENKGRVFEPFFTTKESYGTGLGLWITRELLTKQCGRIRVRSSLGKGTTFSVWLPMDTRAAQARRAA